MQGAARSGHVPYLGPPSNVFPYEQLDRQHTQSGSQQLPEHPPEFTENSASQHGEQCGSKLAALLYPCGGDHLSFLALRAKRVRAFRVQSCNKVDQRRVGSRSPQRVQEVPPAYHVKGL